MPIWIMPVEDDRPELALMTLGGDPFRERIQSALSLTFGVLGLALILAGALSQPSRRSIGRRRSRTKRRTRSGSVCVCYCDTVR